MSSIFFRRESEPESEWSKSLGAFFDAEQVNEYEIDTDGLIEFTTSEDVAMYPHGQFDIAASAEGRWKIMSRREEVIRVFNELILPSVYSGQVDQYMGVTLLLGRIDDEPSKADIIAGPEGHIALAGIEMSIEQTIASLRQ